MSKKLTEKRILKLVEAGGIAVATLQLSELVDESTVLTREDKALYTATLAGLYNVALDRSRPSYRALAKGGN